MSTIKTSTARNLANNTKSKPVWDDLTPRWLNSLLEHKLIDNDTYELNTVTSINNISCDHDELDDVCRDNIDYNNTTMQFKLDVIQTMLSIQSRLMDTMNYPHNQLNEQIRCTLDKLLEQKEDRIIIR